MYLEENGIGHVHTTPSGEWTNADTDQPYWRIYFDNYNTHDAKKLEMLPSYFRNVTIVDDERYNSIFLRIAADSSPGDNKRMLFALNPIRSVLIVMLALALVGVLISFTRAIMG